MHALLSFPFFLLFAAPFFAQKPVPPQTKGEQPIAPRTEVATPKADSMEEEWDIINPKMPPSFPGGERALLLFISQNIWWPKGCEEHYGVIAVQFEIDTLGDCHDWKILKTPGQCFEPVVAAIFAKMPCWSPGKLWGRKVPVRYMLPIRVHLE